MDEYIKKSEAVDVIVKYPYDIAGKTATAIKMIEDLPSADVVPKSEVERQNTDFDLLKSTITHKEEEVYNKGYADAKTSILMDIKAIMQIIILDYKNIGSFDNADIVGYVRDHLIAELEKRHTEGDK